MSGNEYTERHPMEAFLDPQNSTRLFFLFLNHLFREMGYEVRCTIEGDPKTHAQIIRATWKKIEQEKEAGA